MTSSDTASTRRETWIAAVNAGDADRYAAVVTEDVVWIPPSGEPLHGREGFRAWLEPFIDSFSYELELTPSAEHESGRWAWFVGVYLLGFIFFLALIFRYSAVVGLVPTLRG